MANRKTNLVKNTILLVIGTFLNKGLMFVMVPFFSRWLSTEEYGTFDVYTTYVSLFIPFITLACSDAIFRLSQDKNTEEGKAYYISNGIFIVGVNVFITTILLFGWKCLVRFEAFVPFLVLLVSEVLDNYFQGYLRAIKKLSLYAASKSIGALLTSIMVTFFVRFMHLGLSGILYGYALGFLLTDVYIVVATNYKKYFSIRHFSRKGVKELIHYSLPLIPNNISWWIINVSDRTIINIFLGAAANGVYAIAYKIPNICSSVFSMFNISWQETATELVDDADRNNYFQSVYRKMFDILISLCGVMLCCNFIFFDWIFDVKYSDARYYAPILVSAIIFASLSQYFGGIQISLKRPKENGTTTVVGAIVNLIIHFGLVRFVGLYAASISTFFSNVVVMMLRQYKLRDSVLVKLEKKNIIYLMLYIYFFICCYVKLPSLMSFVNLIMAGVIVIIVNKGLINNFIEKRRNS